MHSVLIVTLFNINNKALCRSDIIIPNILLWRKHDRHGLKLSWKEEIFNQRDEDL